MLWPLPGGSFPLWAAGRSIRVTHAQAEGRLSHQKPGERPGMLPRQPLQREHGSADASFGIFGLQDHWTIRVCRLKSPGLWYLVRQGSPRKLIQRLSPPSSLSPQRHHRISLPWLCNKSPQTRPLKQIIPSEFWRPEAKTKVSAGARALPGLWEEPSRLFRFLVAPGVPRLVAASRPSLPLSAHSFSSFVALSSVSYKDTCEGTEVPPG